MKKVIRVAKEGFTLIDGKLQEVTFAKVIASGEDIMYTTNEAGVLKNIKTYENLRGFEDGQEQFNTGKVFYKGDFSENGVYAYKMEGGEPVRVEIDPDVKCSYYGGGEVILPEGMYTSREECLQNSTYYEVGGVEHIGIVKKVQLTDEQKAFIKDELEPMFKKVKEMGIMLNLDCDDGWLRAANVSQMKGRLSTDQCIHGVRYTTNQCFYKVEAYIIDSNDVTVFYDDGERD